MRTIFRKELDIQMLSRRVDEFRRANNGAIPNVLFLNREDYHFVQQSGDCRGFMRYAVHEHIRPIMSSCDAPFETRMEVRNIKFVLHEGAKEPALALVEGM